MCAVVWCYTGPLEKAEERFKPIRAFGPPAIDFVGPIPWPALQSMFDALYPLACSGTGRPTSSTTTPTRPSTCTSSTAPQLPTMHSTMHIYPINGAAHRAAKGDTAFSFRDANFAQVIVGVDPDPANNERMTQWARDYWLAMHPHSAGGGYVNMIMDEGEDMVKAAYRDNYPRLARDQGQVRPGQPVPGEPEHQARQVTLRAGHGGAGRSERRMTETTRSSGQRLVTLSAILEIATGLGFLLAPALVVPLLLRVQMSEGPGALARCFGIAILALGVACLPGRGEVRTGSGAVRGLALYNGLIAVLLAYVAVGLQLGGPLLWPAAVLHAAFAVPLVRR